MKTSYRRLSVLLAVVLLTGNMLLPAASATPGAAATPVSSGAAPTLSESAPRAFSRAVVAASRAHARQGGVRAGQQTGAARASRTAPEPRASIHRAARAPLGPSDGSGSPTFSPKTWFIWSRFCLTV